MGVRLIEGDCLDIMPTLASNSVDLIVSDPPYHSTRKAEWDKQWSSDAEYLSWLGRVCDEWARLLKPNGSLYCFASPRMAWGVEGVIRERFNVLNQIAWTNDNSRAEKGIKEELRRWLPTSERIIFAEHYGSDNVAKGEAGYQAKCDELRGFVFEPLRAYLDGERERSGVSVRAVAEAFQRKSGSRTVTGMAGHWFGRVQWMLPTRENYQWLRVTLASLDGNGDYLRREYEELRREYEELRRPFAVTADVPYTDVWTFPTVPHRKGKHPCEKPYALCSHIVRASSRSGAMVLDCFAGSGVVGEVCRDEGRDCVLVERDAAYCANIRRRLEGLPELPRGVSPPASSSRKVTRRASAGAWLFPELEDVPA
jgi:adenine-specific DNA-methyltransferase